MNTPQASRQLPKKNYDKNKQIIRKKAAYKVKNGTAASQNGHSLIACIKVSVVSIALMQSTPHYLMAVVAH